MTVIVGVDHDKRLVNVVGMGNVTLADAEMHMQHEAREHALGYGRFLDFRGAGVTLAPEDIRQIFRQLQKFSTEHKLGPSAVMVSSDLAFGMMRMLEVLVEDFCEIRPFRDESEARSWLEAKRPSGP